MDSAVAVAHFVRCELRVEAALRNLSAFDFKCSTAIARGERFLGKVTCLNCLKLNQRAK